MSTDDSISEDVSSLGALSHCHAGEGGKESESSEGTSAASGLGLGLGLSGTEEPNANSKTAGGTVDGRAEDITPACSLPHKIRSLCLSTEEAFGPGKSLPFINPSSLETLRALVQEIQSSGETDPEMWKDCEGRWLHLFQLVEKQYQEQILAQQEQYQCQIQLIQDEIKALVQLQNRQTSTQTHNNYPYTPTATTNTQTHHDYQSTLSTVTQTHPDYSSSPAVATIHPSPSTDLPNGNSPLSAPPTSLSVPQPFLSSTFPLPTSTRPGPVTPRERWAERAGTVLSSGYGTLSAWGSGLDGTKTPGGVEERGRGKEESGWSLHLQDYTETILIGQEGQQRSASANEVASRDNPSPPEQQRTSSQPLTSWAQRQRRSKPKKSTTGQAQPPLASPPPLQAPFPGQSVPQTSSSQEQQPSPRQSPRQSPRDSPLENTDLQDKHGSAATFTNSFPLRRSDSLMSEASGLTYWRMDVSELYRPLPDSFDSGAYLLLQEASISLKSPEDQKLSLREIYHSKQRTTESKHTDWDRSLTCSPTSPQVFTLDPTIHLRQSDRTSGFTSPSHFSSPSYPTQPQLYPRVDTPVSPDSMAEGSTNPGDTDCASNASSLSAVAPTLARVASARIKPSPSPPSTSKPLMLPSSQQRKALVTQASEEEGSHTHTSTLKQLAVSGRQTHSHTLSQSGPRMEKAASLEDPVIVSLLREKLREKHTRHVADLKAYYEAEIKVLRDKLDLSDLPHDLEQSNHTLRQRCAQLERALSEASSRIQELENKNTILEKQLADWPERYDTACSTATSLQQRLDESRQSGREKDSSAGRLRTRVRQLEEALENACRETQEKEARREREYKMLQDLLGEYDSLKKDHEGVKDNLVSTENKLFDANEQVSELKRVICKLESQVNQLEHENQARSRQAVHNHTQPSGAGLYHHPDLLLSPSKHPWQPESTYRISPCSQTDQSHSTRKSPCPQTDQSQSYRMSPCPQTDQSGSSGHFTDHTGSRRCLSPPEREQDRGEVVREARGPLTPLMRALIELDEIRTPEDQAPCKTSHSTTDSLSLVSRLGSRRPTVGFVERNHREPPTQDRGKAMEDRGGTGHESGAAGSERGMVCLNGGRDGPPQGVASPGRSASGTFRGVCLLRAQRSLSPEGHRSSSLPPRAQRATFPPTTPTKRETLMMPQSAKSSPKRCPTENYSTAFGNPPPRQQQQLHNRFDVASDQRLHNSSPRKRLFSEATQRSSGGSVESSGSVEPQKGVCGLGWEEQGAGGSGSDLQDPGTDLQNSLHSLADAERLFDELTMEKQQIESALSRMPGSGGRVSLQTRLDEVALENRLESVNRDLGSIRMTLKRFHVLRSSANI